ncbi:hypothetical protein VP1G_11109 [Cytospora mali]|uniref:Zn(2)-C6 fungal-type domain-containing protein n=1 Tax=Cytospora mali TaxID=578113 RepID=A0A194V5V5_CYTMA|nr:hypothetical protein VP1G_11109 [Valsa mali var. pyri (nom. inval.)]
MSTDPAHQLRALLPNPKSKPVPLLSPESTSRTQLASKRRSVAIACESCRKRKTRCEINSLKRACDELKRQNEALGDVIDVLRSRPEEQALEILRLLRAGADASEIFATSTTTSFSFSCL